MLLVSKISEGWIDIYTWPLYCVLSQFNVQMAAMCNVSATETAIIYGLEPVWGAGFAWFLLGERWGLSGWIGAAFVLGNTNSLFQFVIGNHLVTWFLKQSNRFSRIKIFHDFCWAIIHSAEEKQIREVIYRLETNHLDSDCSRS